MFKTYNTFPFKNHIVQLVHSDRGAAIEKRLKTARLKKFFQSNE